jgi:hypothetical protein
VEFRPLITEVSTIGIQHLRSAVRWLGAGVGLAAASYAMYVGIMWFRYGRVRHATGGEAADPLLDRFIPEYEVVERHQVSVAAPPRSHYRRQPKWICDNQWLSAPSSRVVS